MSNPPSSLAILACLPLPSTLFTFPLGPLLLGTLRRRRLRRTVPVNVAQVPPRLDHVPDPPLQLLGLGEPAVGPPVPQDLPLAGLAALVDGDDERPARRGLQRDLPEGEGEGREEFLGVLNGRCSLAVVCFFLNLGFREGGREGGGKMVKHGREGCEA